MNLFDSLVERAIKNQQGFSTLRVTVEKELLHYDILRILKEKDLLKGLTFIGGTCLRMCSGAVRLSEDLNFTDAVIEGIKEKYGFSVTVCDPIKDINDVDTWKIKIVTRPETKHMPTQKINIDICSVKSYEKCSMFLQNNYGVDMGTDGLVIQAQSREEIYAEKLIAFDLRPNRLKYRDLWDMAWLHQRGIQPQLSLIFLKLQDISIPITHFISLFNERLEKLYQETQLFMEFKKEMNRFLFLQHIDLDPIWLSTITLIRELQRTMNIALQDKTD